MPMLCKPTRSALLLAMLSFSGVAHAQWGGAFVENRGQWPDSVLFQASLPDHTVWVMADGWMSDLREPFEPLSNQPAGRPTAGQASSAAVLPEPAEPRRAHALRFRWKAVGSSPTSRVQTHGESSYVLHFLKGPKPEDHVTNVRSFDEVVIERAQGQALRFRARGGLLDVSLSETLTLERTGDAPLHVSGASALSTDSDVLTASTRWADVPVARLLLVRGSSAYAPAVSDAANVGFGSDAVPLRGAFEDSQGARGSSTGAWATYLGGGGQDYPYGVAAYRDGRVVVCGYTTSSDFPTTPGAYDDEYANNDGYVARLSSDGSKTEFVTFIGGGGFGFVRKVVLDSAERIVIGGLATGAFSPVAVKLGTGGRSQMPFVARLSDDGSQVEYEARLDGAFFFNGLGMILDSEDRPILVSAATDEFYTTPGAYDRTYNGPALDGQTQCVGDAYVARITSDGTALDFATFLGGSGCEEITAVALTSVGNIIVGGNTISSDFPTTSGAFNRELSSRFDDPDYRGFESFVSVLSSDGSQLLASTYVGPGIIDDVAAGTDGTLYAITLAYKEDIDNDFPVTPDAFDPSFNGGLFDIYLIGLNASAGLHYATFIGSPSNEYGKSLSVDDRGRIVIIGHTFSSSGFPVSDDAYDTDQGADIGSTEGFILRLVPDGSALDHSTFFGSRISSEGVDAGVINAQGHALIAGIIDSDGLPATSRAFDGTYNGGQDTFVARVPLPGDPVTNEPTVPISELHLGPPHPNPSSGAVSFALYLPHSGQVKIDVYDVIGRYIFAILDGPVPAGTTIVNFDSLALSPGSYLLRATTVEGNSVRMVTITR